MRERERERRRRGKEGLETAAAAAAGAAPRAGDRKCARAQFSPFSSLSPSLPPLRCFPSRSSSLRSCARLDILLRGNVNFTELLL